MYKIIHNILKTPIIVLFTIVVMGGFGIALIINVVTCHSFEKYREQSSKDFEAFKELLPEFKG